MTALSNDSRVGNVLHVIAALLSVAAVGAAETAHGNLTLVDEGAPRAVIVVADEPADDSWADPGYEPPDPAATFQDIVRRMTGATLPVQKESEFDARSIAVLVGPSDLARRMGVDVGQDRDKTSDHYVVRTGDRFVALVGNDDRQLTGTLYAVFDLLQRLGCGWYGPDPRWHVIPERKTLKVPPLAVDERPAFALRMLQATQMEAGYPKQVYRYAWRLGGSALAFDHSLGRVVPREKYLEAHPEYFGPRQPCLSHPEVFDIAADYCRRQIGRVPEGVVPIALGAEDNPSFCQCDRCRAVGNLSARSLNFTNEVARRLSRTHPGRYRLAFYGYWVTHQPPRPMIQAEPGVVCMVVNEGDHAHALDAPESAREREGSRSNQRERLHLEGWRKTGAEMAVYEWWIPGDANQHWRIMPWYSGQTAVRNLRYWHRNEVRYVYYESADIGSPEQRFSVRWPLYYVGARAMWDPKVTSGQVMAEACDRLFGPAAPHMLRFYGRLERAMVETKDKVGNWGLPRPDRVYPSDVEAEAAAHLDRATATSTTPQIAARIEDQRQMWNRARRESLAVLAERRRQIEVGEPERSGLVVHHDYFRGVGNDLTGRGRDAALGPGAVQRADHVELTGRAGARVTFPARGRDGKTLAELIDEGGGAATIIIWFAGKALSGSQDEQYALLDARRRVPDVPDAVRGFTWRLDMARRLPVIDASPDTTPRRANEAPRLSVDDRDAQRRGQIGGMININRPQQYVMIVSAPQPDGRRPVSIHINGRGRSVSQTSLLRNPFALPTGTTHLTVGGKQDESFPYQTPAGRLYRLLIYNRAISDLIDENHEAREAIVKERLPG